MQIVTLTDDRGRDKRYAINDNDDPDEAAEIGIDIGVPDLDQLDVEQLLTDLNNKLFSMGLFTIDDIAAKEGALSAAVQSIFVRKVVKLYKE